MCDRLEVLTQEAMPSPLSVDLTGKSKAAILIMVDGFLAAGEVAQALATVQGQRSSDRLMCLPVPPYAGNSFAVSPLSVFYFFG